MLLTKEVEVKPTGKMIQHYKNKGYIVKWGHLITVKVEDLPTESCVNVSVLCDCCEKIICNPTYRDYKKRVNKFKSYACSKCRFIHFEETCMKEWGVSNPVKLENVRKRMTNTLRQHYNVSNPMQSKEVKAKVNEALCKNGTQKTSKQQLYLHNLFGGEINYPIKYYAVDICFPDEKLVLEYDGGRHDLRVILGRLTQEEFNQKEIIRNSVIKREGYKQMRIISSHDLLPSDQILLQMLSDARKYFSDYPNHSWIEFNIDSSILRNAEHKDGILYDYGELRAIKEIA